MRERERERERVITDGMYKYNIVMSVDIHSILSLIKRAALREIYCDYKLFPKVEIVHRAGYIYFISYHAV